jgi:PAS domain S-box-containing protein
MDKKPTYEELEQRNKDLEKEAVNCKRTEELLQESEKRFKNVTNSIEELLVLLDQNFKVQLINSTLAQAYNISLDEYAGKHCYELFYGRNDICEGCPAIKVLNDGEVTRASLRYRPDGRIYYRTAYPFIEDNGDITGVIVIGCDITEQKQAEEKLRESEEKYRLLVENQTDMIVTFDTEGFLLFVSPSYLETFDKTEDKLIGKKFMPFIHEEDRKAVAKAIANVHKPPYTAYIEERVMTKEGWRWQAWLNTAILNEQGKVESIVAVGRDITDIKQTEQRLKQREKELEIKNIRLEEMNVALKVLIDKRDEDKRNLEENVLANVNNLILPYLNKLKEIVSDATQKMFIEVLETNVNEIISPFAHKLLLKYMSLTPTEIKVANLVKQGMRTKEIANMLDISPKTIETHRENIRKKIGIRNKKANLRSHLLSLHQSLFNIGNFTGL